METESITKQVTWGIKAALVSILCRCFDFRGRASRSEFWYAYLGGAIISTVTSLITGLGVWLIIYTEETVCDYTLVIPAWLLTITGAIATLLYTLLFMIPYWAVFIRRLHDTGRSWKSLLYLLIPFNIGQIILLVFLIQASREANQYGERAAAPSGENEKMPKFIGAVIMPLTRLWSLLCRKPVHSAITVVGVAGLYTAGAAVMSNTDYLGTLIKEELRYDSSWAAHTFRYHYKQYLRTGEFHDAILPHLLYACGCDNVPLDIIKTLVENGANVNARYGENSSFELKNEKVSSASAWEIACIWGRIDLIDYLASVNAKKTEAPMYAGCYGVRDDSKKTFLTMARYNPALTEALVRHGLNVNTPNYAKGESPLMLANYETAKILIKAGADVNYYSKRNYNNIHENALDRELNITPANVKKMELLIEHGAKFSKPIDAETMLYHTSYPETMAFLLKQGGNINAVHIIKKEGYGYSSSQKVLYITPLLRAISDDNEEAVEFLLNNGADVHLKTPQGVSAASLLPEITNPTIKKLIKKAIEDQKQAPAPAQTPAATPAPEPAETPAPAPLDAPAETPTATPAPESAETPAQAPQDAPAETPTATPAPEPAETQTPAPLAEPAETPAVTPVPEPAETPAPAPQNTDSTNLHEAVKAGKPSLVKAALAQTSNLEIRDAEDHTALMVAALEDRSTSARLLIQAGADVNARSQQYGTTVLMMAAMKGYNEVVAELLAAGAKVNETNKSKYTALMLAARGNHKTVIQQLLKAGARKGMKDSSGKKAVDHATSSDVKRLLR
ncbi:MAG: ankyrin repeat domain-containing protein [Akkermansia sp.]|nr:ankyrin repeat domain-containing protein [Akkermansia sp.]